MIPLNTDERNNLIITNIPLVKKVITNLSSYNKSYLETSDLLVVGIMGLINAVDTYNPTKGIKFSTYATNKIRYAILDEFRVMNPVTRFRRLSGKRNAELVIYSLETLYEFVEKEKNNISIDTYSYCIEDNIVDIIDNHSLIKKLISNLPSVHKKIMELLYFEELSPTIVSERMNLSINSIYIYHHEAIKEFREKLGIKNKRIKNESIC